MWSREYCRTEQKCFFSSVDKSNTVCNEGTCCQNFKDVVVLLSGLLQIKANWYLRGKIMLELFSNAFVNAFDLFAFPILQPRPNC